MHRTLRVTSRKSLEIFSELTIKTTENDVTDFVLGVFIINSEYTLQLFLVFLLLT